MNYSAIGSIFNAVSDAVVGIENGAVVFLNPCAERLLHVQELTELCRMLEQDGAENLRFTFETDGRSYSVSAAHCDGLWLLCLSGTSENKGEAALAQGVSTQMSQALISLRAAADSLTEQMRFGGEVFEQSTGILYRSIFRLQRLSANLSVLSGIKSGNLHVSRSTTEMCRFIGDLTDTLDLFFPHCIELGISDSEVFADIDEQLISVMLLNVVANSVQRFAEGSRIRLSLKTHAGRVIITVSDNCGGMTAEMLGRVFAKYSRQGELYEAADGIGLGLTVARGIAHAHGGAMLIESREGEGTQVHIQLPVTAGGTVASCRGFAGGIGMELILRELSEVLGREFYTEKYMD